MPPSNIPFLALGAWILTIGWFGFNVMSAQTLDGISGLVAVNSLMAMVGGTLVALLVGRADPGFIHNGPLAGVVVAFAGGLLVYGVIKSVAGLRLSEEEEYQGADLSIHKIGATSED
jgi:Amt family ammonium transporter